MSSLVQRAVDAIIRPPRKIYDQSSIPQYLKGDDEITYIRHPIGFINKRNIALVGSYYHGVGVDPTGGGPCVLYLHGNASSQLEGQFLVPNLCKYGIYVCCFDFAGCGCSGGKYVSLGYYEKEDTEFLLDQLHKNFNLGPFILWGRSMGAATALLVDYPHVIGRISDSSFTSIPDMCSAIAESMSLPSLFVPAVIWYLKKQVIEYAKFDIEEVAPISVNHPNELPAVFGHAEKDEFIPFEQCRRLYDHYQSKMKYIMIFEGGHNSKRAENWILLGVCFILENFCIDVKNPVISTCRKLQESVFHFSSFSAMMNETDKNTNDGDAEENYLDDETDENNKKDKEKTKIKSKEEEKTQNKTKEDNKKDENEGKQHRKYRKKRKHRKTHRSDDDKNGEKDREHEHHHEHKEEENDHEHKNENENHHELKEEENNNKHHHEENKNEYDEHNDNDTNVNKKEEENDEANKHRNESKKEKEKSDHGNKDDENKHNNETNLHKNDKNNNNDENRNKDVDDHKKDENDNVSTMM